MQVVATVVGPIYLVNHLTLLMAAIDGKETRSIYIYAVYYIYIINML